MPPNWWEKIKPYVELVGVCLLAIYTGFTIAMYFANKRAADAAKSAAETASGTLGEIQKQTNLMRQEVSGTFGAVIPLNSPGPAPIPNDLQLLKEERITMSFANVGQVRAKAFVANATLTRRTLPELKVLGRAEELRIVREGVRPHGQNGLRGYADDASLQFDTETFSKRDLIRIEDRKETVQIAGDFQYDNGFGEIVHQHFCFEYITIPQHASASGAGTGGQQGAWYFCDYAKSVLEQFQHWK
jgi:hypothetical protein